MAFTLAFTLQTDGLDSGFPIHDIQYVPYGGDIPLHTFVTVDKASPDISDDGSTRLYVAPDGTYDVETLGAIVDGYSPIIAEKKTKED